MSNPHGCFYIMKIKMSGIGITDARGKIGGTTLQKNFYGLLAKNIGRAVKSRTIYTNFQRTNFAILSQMWRALTSAEQLSFNTNAVNFPTTDSLGNVIILSGFSLFIELNLNLATISQPYITTCPTSPNASIAFNATLVKALADTNLCILLDDISANVDSAYFYYVVSVSTILSAGVSNARNTVRNILVVYPGFLNLKTNYDFPFTQDDAWTVQEIVHGGKGCVQKKTASGGDWLYSCNLALGFFVNTSTLEFWKNGTTYSVGAHLDAHFNFGGQIGGMFDITAERFETPFIRDNVYKRFGTIAGSRGSTHARVILIDRRTGVASAPLYISYTP